MLKKKWHGIPIAIVSALLASVLITSSAVAVFTVTGDSDVETSMGNDFQAGTVALDLTVNDQEPWIDGAPFAFTGILPGGEPMLFNFKLHNVGDADGILTFSMSVSENDMADAPLPNMSADEFASLIYVEAVSYLYKWPDDPATAPDGYIGSLTDDLDSWLDIDRYHPIGNDDGYVSLYELCGASPIPYGSYEGDQLEATAEITYFIQFQLGDSLDGGEAGDDIILGVEDNDPQGDGVSVTITATLAPYTP